MSLPWRHADHLFMLLMHTSKIKKCHAISFSRLSKLPTRLILQLLSKCSFTKLTQTCSCKMNKSLMPWTKFRKTWEDFFQSTVLAMNKTRMCRLAIIWHRSMIILSIRLCPVWYRSSFLKCSISSSFLTNLWEQVRFRKPFYLMLFPRYISPRTKTLLRWRIMKSAPNLLMCWSMLHVSMGQMKLEAT